jgi:hypothetical protein
LNECGACAGFIRRGGQRFGSALHLYRAKGGLMSLWLLILIIVLVVLALGGFGYSRR